MKLTAHSYPLSSSYAKSLLHDSPLQQAFSNGDRYGIRTHTLCAENAAS